MRADKVVVPATWLASAVSFTFCIAVSGTFYVAKVNERLARIEAKLGIAATDTPLAITQAHADTLDSKPGFYPQGDHRHED